MSDDAITYLSVVRKHASELPVCFPLSNHLLFGLLEDLESFGITREFGFKTVKEIILDPETDFTTLSYHSFENHEDELHRKWIYRVINSHLENFLCTLVNGLTKWREYAKPELILRVSEHCDIYNIVNNPNPFIVTAEIIPAPQSNQLLTDISDAVKRAQERGEFVPYGILRVLGGS